MAASKRWSQPNMRIFAKFSWALFLSGLFLGAAGRAEVIFTDDFTGNTIDTNKRTVATDSTNTVVQNEMITITMND